LTNCIHANRSRFRSSVGAIGIIAALLSAAGCAASSTSAGDRSARFDPDTGAIILPLDPYSIDGTPEGLATIVAVHRLELRHRLADAGAALPPLDVEELLRPVYDDDRRYGIWDANRTERFGYGKPASEVDEFDGVPESVRTECGSAALEALADFGAAGDQQPTIPQRLAEEAALDAERDPQWEVVKDRWRDCLREQGLTPPTGPNEWVSAEGVRVLMAKAGDEVSAEGIRIATIEATCNRDTGMAQELALIEAREQSVRIDANEAALAEERLRIDDALARARERIAQLG